MAVRAAALISGGASGASPAAGAKAGAPSHRRGATARGMFALAIGALALWGWQHRNEGAWIAASGAGYVFGVVGGTLLALTPLYSMRKRLRPLRSAGKLGLWFRSHMLAGIVGPLFILFHCNFQAGSTNSAVALATMLVVVASGLIGRYLYGKIHRGLDGHRATLSELRLDAQATRARLQPILVRVPRLHARMVMLEATVQAPVAGVLRSGFRHVALSVRTRSASLTAGLPLARALHEQGRERRWGLVEQWRRWRAARGAVRAHLTAVRKVGQFSFYERVFALWHLLHIPLFCLLVITGVVHVVAVHLY